MSEDLDLDALAGEYVLGTLRGGERAAFAERLLQDGAARAAVQAWERRLAPLAQTAPAETPPDAVWHQIEANLARRGAAAAATSDGGNVVVLRRRLAGWRAATVGASAIAAGALGWIALAPTLTPPANGRYVAVVDTGGHEPALIAEVDTRTGTIRVRSLAAETPAGHSLELWHIAEGHEPRSLGILQAGLDAQAISDPASATTGPVNGLIAVTVEPAGGSSSGKPTGPVVYSGRLVPMDE